MPLNNLKAIHELKIILNNDPIKVILLHETSFEDVASFFSIQSELNVVNGKFIVNTLSLFGVNY